MRQRILPGIGGTNFYFGVVFLEANAFDIVRDKLEGELSIQGFEPPVPIEDEDGRAEMFVMEDVAYSLLYDKKRQRFELRSTMLDDEKNPGDWKNLSLWLYDEETGVRADLESISNDFIDVIRGPKRIEFVQKKKKRSKDDERNIDPQFFFNRLVKVFPELKTEMNEERITYGQIRFATFAKEKIVPKFEDFAKKYSTSEPFESLCEICSDMYTNADLDCRSILTVTILNSLSEDSFAKMQEKFSDELKKDTGYTRKLIGKNIKPEKKKKEKKVVARLDS